jgi:hypothetical protein
MQHTVEKLCGRLDDQAKEKLALLSGKLAGWYRVVIGTCINVLVLLKYHHSIIPDQRHHLKKQALDIAAQSHELEKIVRP